MLDQIELMHGSRFNNRSLKEKRQFLRRNATREERVLWEHLRKRQLRGLKFRRQHSVDYMIIDFYCPQIRLGIELDGRQHNEENHQKQDLLRDQYLATEFGIKILRFENHRIRDDVINVIAAIEIEVDKIVAQSDRPE